MERSSKELVDACIYIDEQDHTFRVQLDQKSTLIGTSPECDVLLKDKNAHGLLGEFIATRRRFEFRSKGAPHISLNGRTIRENQRLYHGDVLTFGETRVRYFEVPEVSQVTLQLGIAGIHSGHSFFLTNQSIVRIGQTVGELRIPDATLGDPQVAIENLGLGATYIRQLDSTTETTINGVKLSSRVPIRDGTVLQMGETHITVRTVSNLPLPAPSELLLQHGEALEEPTENDQKRTAPEKLKAIQKAHIRAGGDLVKSSSEKVSRPLDEQETVDLGQIIPSEALARLNKTESPDSAHARKPLASAPTPQPYTIRQEDLHNARRQKEPGGAELPYYLQTRKQSVSADKDDSFGKPYGLDRERAATNQTKGSPGFRRSSQDASDRPYYMPQPGSQRRPEERNSPLDWMENRPPQKDDDQAGSTIIIARDVVDDAMNPSSKYYVPDSGSRSPSKDDLNDDVITDRSGITLQDATLDDLDES